MQTAGAALGTREGLAVRVLGPVRVEHDGVPASIGGPRQRAVLARLVLAEGRLVTVERLVEDVWGGGAPATAIGTLQSYLSLLRRALGDPSLLRREGPGYALDVPAERVDATAFEQLAERGRRRVTEDPPGALADLDAALALWRGQAYADVADEAWASAAAVRLDELRLAALEARFDALLATGRHTAAVAELERAVDEHPLRERFAAQLLLALYRSGRQADALRAYDRTRDRLVDELGLDPGPELVQLQADILAHEPTLALAPVAPVAPVPRATPTQADPAPTRPATASPVRLPAAAERHRDQPFVGRHDALASMREAWDAALQGNRRLAVIAGEAGAGKSRLASRFVTELHAEGAVVLWGRATPEAIVPFEPVVEAMRTVLRSVSPDAQRRVVEGRDALSLLLPDLADLVPGVQVVKPEVGTERYVLFETVADMLDAESALFPGVFVLDDLQWADPLTLRLLDHVLRHERPTRVLLIGTMRTLPSVSSPELDAFLAALHRDGLLTRVNLDGLDAGEVVELLEAGGWDEAVPAAAAIHEATKGNPFFVTELAATGATDELPSSVRDALGTRLDRLDERTTRLVAIAAVAGPVVELPVLAASSGVQGEALLDAIDAAVAAGVLTEEGPSGSLTFPHSLIQQAVLERLTRSRRSALHLAVAGGLNAAGEPSAAELAHHLLEAGVLAPREELVAAAVRAGCESLGLLAYEDADRWAERALAAASGGVPDRLRCEALLLRSDAQRALGHRPEARDAATEAAEAARASQDPLLLARAAEALAVARAGIGFDFGTEDPHLAALLQEALAALPESESSHRMLLQAASAQNMAVGGDTAAARGLSREVLELVDPDEHPTLVATTNLAYRMAGWRRDLLDERLAADRAALAAAERARSASLELNALLYGVTDLTEAGLSDEAAAWMERLRERAAEVRQPAYDAFVLFLDATQRLLEGEYDESARLCDEALTIGRESHGENAEQAWFGHAFIRAWDKGELAGLVAIVEDAVDRHASQPIWGMAAAACLVAAGRTDEARTVLARFVKDGELHWDDNALWLTGGCVLIEIARALGDVERSAVLRRVLEPYAGRTAVSGLGRATLGPVVRFVGVAAATAGDLDGADRLLARGADACRAVGARPHLARALWDRAGVLRRRGGPGDEDLAVELLAEADELAAAVGLALGDLAGRR